MELLQLMLLVNQLFGRKGWWVFISCWGNKSRENLYSSIHPQWVISHSSTLRLKQPLKVDKNEYEPHCCYAQRHCFYMQETLQSSRWRHFFWQKKKSFAFRAVFPSGHQGEPQTLSYYVCLLLTAFSWQEQYYTIFEQMSKAFRLLRGTKPTVSLKGFIFQSQ